jgi:hypothetical protein
MNLVRQVNMTGLELVEASLDALPGTGRWKRLKAPDRASIVNSVCGRHISPGLMVSCSTSYRDMDKLAFDG